jgi:ribosome-associated translation inhibitor RaiA
MQIPVIIHWRDVEKTDALEALVRKQAAKLDALFDHIISCRVAIERPQKAGDPGAPYRVRLDLTTPPEHELVVRCEPAHGVLRTIINDAFKSMRRQLRDLHERRRGRPRKKHVEALAFVARLFREEGYGFLRTPDGRDVFFDRQSVTEGDWDGLAVGTAVRFAERLGHEGLRAATVQVVHAPDDAASRSSGGARRRTRA